jgi:hypothetical protein
MECSYIGNDILSSLAKPTPLSDGFVPRISYGPFFSNFNNLLFITMLTFDAEQF